MPITIDDLARHLELSVSTVSKALNDYPDVSAETKARVLSATRQLDYHPSAAARNLRRQRTNKIGLLLPEYSVAFIGEYLSEMLTGAMLAAEKQEYNILLYTTKSHQPERLTRICRTREVDGMLVIGAGQLESEVKLLQKEAMPFVVLSRHIENATGIVPDNFNGALMLMRHLIELGHKRIGFTARPELYETATERMAGYRQALREAGIAFDKKLVVTTSIEPRSGYHAMNKLLDLPNPPTALFAIHDLVAVDALQAAQARGLRVPQDIAIAGFDGLHASLITKPPITTVRQPIPQIGQQAVEMLLRRIDDNDQLPVRITLPVELIVRESTTGQPSVAK